MPGGVITVNVGGAGVRIGAAVLNQYLAEHQIELDGTPGEGFDRDSTTLTTFFEETRIGSYVPRSVSVDLEPSALDALRHGPLADVVHPEFLVNGKEDAANNFARGYYTVGKEMMDVVSDRIRKLVENCDSVQGFMVNHSLGGGTGSGMGALVLERIAVDYRKQSKIGCEVLAGDPFGRKNPCNSYNELLGTQKLVDLTDTSLLFDNKQMGAMCQKQLKIKPSYEHVNSLIARVIAGTTSQWRFDHEVDFDLNEFHANMVPFPRLHFLTCSVPGFKISGSNSVRDSADNAVQPGNMTLDFPKFDPVEDKYLSMTFLCRGGVSSRDANMAVKWLQQSEKINFVEWVPSGASVVLLDKPQPKAEGICLETEEDSVSMIGNNVAVSRVITRNCINYDKLYSQRAYVSHYVNEGMEEGEFGEAREDLGFLEKDYLDVVSEQAGDEDEDEDEEWR